MACATAGAFHHEALFYHGEEEFLAGTVPFIREALERQEPVMVAVSAAKIGALRDELGRDAREVDFADMGVIGANPARIIPVWRDFVDARGAGGSPVRGIGEPISDERRADELVECQRHESLLNLAFADAAGFRLLCPYDSATLAPAVIEEAHRSHPVVARGRTRRPSVVCRDLEAVRAPFAEPLPEPAPHVAVDALTVRGPDPAGFRALRDFVLRHAARAGFESRRCDEIVLAVHELAVNSVRHGGGEGRVRVWRDQRALVCEVRDEGRIDRPLAGRERPALDQIGGWGLWLVNQLCDLVQVRTFATGSAVRVHVLAP